MSERKNWFGDLLGDWFGVSDTPPMGSRPEDIARWLDGARQDLRRAESDLEKMEDRVQTLRNAIAEMRDRTIPRYEQMLDEAERDRDYGLRSDDAPMDTKAIPGAHGAYR